MEKIMCLSVVLASAFAFSALGDAAHAQPRAAPDWVKIASIQAAGSGCSSRNVRAQLSPDNHALLFTSLEIEAELDPTVTPSVNNPSKACNISMLLDYPAGWTFTLVSADHVGRASLEEGTLGQQTSTTWFQGDLVRGGTFSTTLQGPFFGAGYKRREALSGPAAWAPCYGQRYLNINVDVSVSNSQNPTAKAYMKGVARGYQLAWKECR